MISSLAKSTQNQSIPGETISTYLAGLGSKGMDFAINDIWQRPYRDHKAILVSATYISRSRELKAFRQSARQSLAHLDCGATYKSKHSSQSRVQGYFILLGGHHVAVIWV